MPCLFSKNYRHLLAIAYGIIISLIGCVTPPEVSFEYRSPPSWATTPPLAIAEYEYFIVQERSRSIEAATDILIERLVSRIARYIGISSFDSDIADYSAIEQKLRDQLASAPYPEETPLDMPFAIIIRHIARQSEDAPYIVSIFARYDRAALEDLRLQTLQASYLALPEADDLLIEGSRAELGGQYYQALQHYASAARAAAYNMTASETTTSVAMLAEDRLHTSLARMNTLLERIRISSRSTRLETTLGDPFSQPFTAQISVGGDNLPAGNAPLLVSYQALLPNGDVGVRTYTIMSDDDGLARFSPPPIGIAGEGIVNMVFVAPPELAEIKTITPDSGEIVDEIARKIRARGATFQFNVLRRNVSGKIGVVIVDVDLARNVLSQNYTAASLEAVLTQSNIDIEPLQYDNRLAAQKNDEQNIATIITAFTGHAEKIIYGVARLDSFDDDVDSANQTTFEASVTAKIYLIDLDSGEEIYTVSLSQRAASSNIDTAIPNAFLQLGERLGLDLAPQLR